MSAKDLLRPRPKMKPAEAPRTKYTEARQEWANVIGGPIKQARSWRLAFFGSQVVLGLAVIGLIYQSSKATVTPYLVEHDPVLGDHRSLGPVEESATYTPSTNEIRRDLSSWISYVRSVPLDPVVVKGNWLKAYAFTRQSAANALSQWANNEPRLQSVGRETVEVQVMAVTPIPNSNSYQARWHETIRTLEGSAKEESNWTATITLDDFKPPRDPYGLSVNPLGIFIKNYQWTRDAK